MTASWTVNENNKRVEMHGSVGLRVVAPAPHGQRARELAERGARWWSAQVLTAVLPGGPNARITFAVSVWSASSRSYDRVLAHLGGSIPEYDGRRGFARDVARRFGSLSEELLARTRDPENLVIAGAPGDFSEVLPGGNLMIYSQSAMERDAAKLGFVVEHEIGHLIGFGDHARGQPDSLMNDAWGGFSRVDVDRRDPLHPRLVPIRTREPFLTAGQAHDLAVVVLRAARATNSGHGRRRYVSSNTPTMAAGTGAALQRIRDYRDGRRPRRESPWLAR